MVYEKNSKSQGSQATTCLNDADQMGGLEGGNHSAIQNSGKLICSYPVNTR
jgi:hypothetical protein